MSREPLAIAWTFTSAKPLTKPSSRLVNGQALAAYEDILSHTRRAAID